MDKKELKLASQILANEFLQQAKPYFLQIAKGIMVKFDRGPKPRRSEKATANLRLEISCNILYEIEEVVKLKNRDQYDIL